MRCTSLFPVTMLLMLAACDDYEPREKRAVYDPSTQELVTPYPCPDWSKSSVWNAENARHSNYGCAVENNLAVQLDDPTDLVRGHGISGPDIETTVRTLERYRSGEIPAPLQPVQSSGTSGGGS